MHAACRQHAEISRFRGSAQPPGPETERARRTWEPGSQEEGGGGGEGGVQLKLGLFRSWNRVYGTKHHDQLRNRPSSGFAMCARQELNNLNIGRGPGFKLFNSRPRIK